MHLHHTLDVKIKETTLILLINKDIRMHVNTIAADRVASNAAVGPGVLV